MHVNENICVHVLNMVMGRKNIFAVPYRVVFTTQEEKTIRFRCDALGLSPFLDAPSKRKSIFWIEFVRHYANYLFADLLATNARRAILTMFKSLGQLSRNEVPDDEALAIWASSMPGSEQLYCVHQVRHLRETLARFSCIKSTWNFSFERLIRELKNVSFSWRNYELSCMNSQIIATIATPNTSSSSNESVFKLGGNHEEKKLDEQEKKALTTDSKPDFIHSYSLLRIRGKLFKGGDYLSALFQADELRSYLIRVRYFFCIDDVFYIRCDVFPATRFDENRQLHFVTGEPLLRTLFVNAEIINGRAHVLPFSPHSSSRVVLFDLPE